VDIGKEAVVDILPKIIFLALTAEKSFLAEKY
jgi:hypothetical protein